MERAVGAALLGFVKAAIVAGMTPANALRVCAFAMIEASLGREATATLGVPESTARRWRLQLAELDGSKLPTDVPEEFLNKLLPVLGFPDLRLVRRGGAEDG